MINTSARSLITKGVWGEEPYTYIAVVWLDDATEKEARAQVILID
jgi:hypothetical protein